MLDLPWQDELCCDSPLAHLIAEGSGTHAPESNRSKSDLPHHRGCSFGSLTTESHPQQPSGGKHFTKCSHTYHIQYSTREKTKADTGLDQFVKTAWLLPFGVSLLYAAQNATGATGTVPACYFIYKFTQVRNTPICNRCCSDTLETVATGQLCSSVQTVGLV